MNLSETILIAAQGDQSAAPPYIVNDSPVHGKGVFAARAIAADTFVIEYQGERISAKQSLKRYNPSPDNPHHTFYFSLESGKIIDGDNDARWINHACAPNCEAREEDGQIFIYTLRDIAAGEELNYDYGLVLEERHTQAVKRDYQCLCGAAICRNTMLAPKSRRR